MTDDVDDYLPSESPELYALIGEIAVLGAQIERRTFGILTVLAGGDRVLGLLVQAEGFSWLRERCGTFLSLAHMKNMPWRVDLNRALDSAGVAMRHRNAVIHGVYLNDTVGRLVRLHPQRLKQVDFYPVTTRDLFVCKEELLISRLSLESVTLSMLDCPPNAGE